MENHSATFKVEYLDYTKLPDDVKVAYLQKNDGKRIVKDDRKKFQNGLMEDTRGSIVSSCQSLKAVAECGDNKKDFDFDDTKKFVLYSTFEEWHLQHHCHSNECNDIQGYICFTTTKSDFQI